MQDCDWGDKTEEVADVLHGQAIRARKRDLKREATDESGASAEAARRFLGRSAKAKRSGQQQKPDPKPSKDQSTGQSKDESKGKSKGSQGKGKRSREEGNPQQTSTSELAKGGEGAELAAGTGHGDDDSLQKALKPRGAPPKDIERFTISMRTAFFECTSDGMFFDIDHSLTTLAALRRSSNKLTDQIDDPKTPQAVLPNKKLLRKELQLMEAAIRHCRPPALRPKSKWQHQFFQELGSWWTSYFAEPVTLLQPPIYLVKTWWEVGLRLFSLSFPLCKRSSSFL